MKYDLGKLTKEEIETIIKNLPPKFAGVYCYAPSSENKIIKPVGSSKNGVTDLYDNNNKIRDKWGEYDINKNLLYIMAWDQECFWNVGVYLFEDHFEIPKYKNSFIKHETEKNFAEYRKLLSDIFSKKVEDNTDLTM